MASYTALGDSSQVGKPMQEIDIVEHKPWKQLDNEKKRRVTFLMVLSFLAGVVCAVVQDRFYASFHHRTADSEFQQRVIHTAGTAFAFLTKLFLALAAAMAYTQRFWLVSCRTPATVAQIDTMTNVLSNIFGLVHAKLWAKHLLLALLAASVWIIPLSAIFTPGAMVVLPTETNVTISAAPAQAQQSWIGQQKYASTLVDGTAETCSAAADGTKTCSEPALIRSPSTDLSRAAQLSAFQSSIVVPDPILPRMSYSTSFFGPALSCDGLSDQDKSTYNNSLTTAYAQQDLWLLHQVSAVLTDDYEVLYNAWAEGYQEPTGELDDVNWNNGTVQYAPSELDAQYFAMKSTKESYNLVLLNCTLHNASYTVDYFYNDTVRRADLSKFDLLDVVPFNSTVEIESPDYTNIVYNAVYFAFNQLMLGTVANASNYDTPPSNGGLSILYTLQDMIQDPSLATTDSVSQRLESLFQNITISAISAPSLQANDTEAKQLSVTTWDNRNWYVYDPKVVYISYGIAILVSAICVMIGLWAIKITGTGYRDDFSTFVASSRMLVTGIDSSNISEFKDTEVILRHGVFRILPREKQFDKANQHIS